MKRVTFVCHNLSANGITRGLLLIHALQGRAKVSLAGFVDPKRGLHNSLNGWGATLPIHSEAAPAGVLARGAFGRLVEQVKKSKPDLVIALKPRPGSLDVAVAAVGKENVIVDIDDDELAFHRQRPGWVQAYKTVLGLPSVFGIHRLVAMEALAKEVRDRWCASSVLQERFGGVLLPHPVDPKPYEAATRNRQAVRASLGWQDKIVVLFSGTLREHKGFPLLAQAVAKAANPALHLGLLGAEPEDPALAPFKTLLGGRLLVLGRVGSKEVPAYLAAADIVAVPTLDRPAARAQVPIKLVEAMMAGKAVITTAVGDGAQLVEGAGLVIRPGDPAALTGALNAMADSEPRRRTGGERCQDRAMALHWGQVQERLHAALGE